MGFYNKERSKYLESPKWKELRKQIYERYGGECQRCHTVIPIEHANIHHRSYKRFGNESEKDLILYCNRCHTIVHQRRQNDRAVNITIQEMLRDLTLDEKYKVVSLVAELRGENVNEYIAKCTEIQKEKQKRGAEKRKQKMEKRNERRRAS